MVAGDMAEVIKRIETKYDVSQIRYEDTFIWSYLRTYLFFSYQNKEEPIFRKKVSHVTKALRLIRAVSKTDFRLFYKKNPIIMFVDGDDVCTVDGKKKTKLFETVRKMYRDKCVPIRIPVENIKETPYKYFIDSNIISYQLRRERKKLNFDENRLKGREIVKSILLELDIPDFDYLDIIKKILAAKIYFRKWFRKVNPEKIFVSCYYDYNRMPAISIAKEMGIKTIEFQHGYIGYDHAAYRAYGLSSREAYPDYYLSFGKKFSEIISEAIYAPDSIFEVGNGYLEIMSRRDKQSKELLRKKYPSVKGKKIMCIIGVAMEYYDMHAINLGLNLLDMTEGFAIVFKPRYGKVYNVSHKDFYFEDDMDVYQCMQASDVTLTGMSTCAFESLYLGTPLVLDNIDNFAKTRFENYFSDIKSAVYVNENDDIVEKVTKVIDLDKNFVRTEGSLFYATNNKKRVKQALSIIDNV